MEEQAQLDRLCRLCLKKAESLEDIFGNSDSSSLVLRIMACVSLEVHKTDNLPKKICPQCRYQMEKTYIFRSKCRDNDTKLRRHVKLLAAGKVSTMLEELDDEDEFESSLQFIRAIDGEKERDRAVELGRAIRAHEAKLKADWEQEKRLIWNVAMREALQNRRDNMVDVGVETCRLEGGSCESFQDENYLLESEPPPVPKIEEISDGQEIESLNNIDHPVEHGELEIEPLEESEQADDGLSDPSSVDVRRELRAKIHARLAREEEEIISYLEDDSTLMEVDNLDDGDENASAITVLNEELQPTYSESDMAIQDNQIHSQRFLITEVSDSETYILEDELTQEERNLYGEHSNMSDDSDEDLEAVTNAVKAELAEQPGFNVGENCIMKVEKNRDLTKVEVRANDGSVICMEFSTEPKKKAQTSLRALRAKMIGEFQCPHCSMKFKSPKAVQGHVAEAHPETSKGQVCDVCAKWCPTKTSLERHYRIHTGEKPFVCGECGRAFVQKEILKRHMMVHTQEKPFACEQCPKRFTQKEQLRIHANKNHATNPIISIYKCDMCSKEFKYGSGLSRHLASHYGRRFPCECGKEFSDKSALKRHMWVVHGKGRNEKDSTTTIVHT